VQTGGGQQQAAQCWLYGQYGGTVTGGGATGIISITISTNNQVTGNSSGTLDGYPYTASISGTFDPSSGSIQASLQGNVAPKTVTQKYPFTGSLSGRYQNNGINGQWKGVSKYDNSTGSWNVLMERPITVLFPCSFGTVQPPVTQKDMGQR